MRRTITLAVLSTALVSTARTASAHPGHGLDGGSYSLVHYLTEPLHLGVGAALVLLAAGTIAMVRRARAPQSAEAPRTTRRPRPRP